MHDKTRRPRPTESFVTGGDLALGHFLLLRLLSIESVMAMAWRDPEFAVDLAGEAEEKSMDYGWRGDTSSGGSCIYISDDDDECDENVNMRAPVTVVDLSQDFDGDEDTGGNTAPVVAMPRSPTVAGTIALQAALASWLETNMRMMCKGSLLWQHEVWSARTHQLSDDTNATLLALEVLECELVEMQDVLGVKKELAKASEKHWASKRKEFVSKIEGDVQREAAAAADEDTEFVAVDAWQRRLNGPDRDQDEQLKSARVHETVKVAEADVQLGCVASMRALVALQRVRVKLSNDDSQIQRSTIDPNLLVASISDDEIATYAIAFETQWALLPTKRELLLDETTAFWRSARFWLPRGVRELVAKQIEDIPVAAAKSALTSLARDLRWSQSLVV